jgi:hypothetical protein
MQKNLIMQEDKFKGYNINHIYHLDPQVLEVDENNTQKINIDKQNRLEESILNVGQYASVLVNKRNGRVLSGNTRLSAIQSYNKHNQDKKQLKVKVEFLDIDSKTLELNIMESMNLVYEDKREATNDNDGIIERAKELMIMKSKNERVNGKPITNINNIIASDLGIGISRINKAVASWKKSDEAIEFMSKNNLK